jgi:hypothetical protein
MDISTIQKRKFLNNIYKILYSKGTKPSEQEVRREFAKYFSVFKPGIPIPVNYSLLDSFNTTNVDVLNELMINSIFNIEILYDAVHENNEQMFSLMTSLNNKLEGLKAKRKELEAKVDDLMFSKSNFDGYFYSFLETFATISNIDMGLTSSYIDLVNNNITLPKLSNISSTELLIQDIGSASVTYSSRMNGEEIEKNIQASNFETVFDGLNDTYWSHEITSAKPGIAVVAIQIPISTSFAISKVEGSLLTSSPCAVSLVAVSQKVGEPDIVRVKDSTSDYSRFSFSIPAGFYSSISIILSKTEPDAVKTGPSGSYAYRFGFRELGIYSSYYDQRSILVSKPISVPVGDNKNLAISAVALSADIQMQPGTDLNFYVAADNPGATSVSGFNWIKIEPSVDDQPQNIVNISSSNIRELTINSSGSDLVFIPENFTSTNINEQNPAYLPYSDKVVYRVASVSATEKFIEPYILSGINSFRHYGIILSDYKLETESYKSLSTWSDYLNIENRNDLVVDTITNQINSITPPLFSSSVGFIEANIQCAADQVAVHSLVKSREDFNLGLFLNGIMIGDLPKGTLSKSIEWNFTKGINKIVITYDKNFSGLINFNLMPGKSINEYGTLFLDYFSYLDPIQFRNTFFASKNIFTIDNIFGNREILASKNINTKSALKYYNNASDLVEAIRYRVDLVRFDNPLQTPTLDNIRIKFKHNDLGS